MNRFQSSSEEEAGSGFPPMNPFIDDEKIQAGLKVSEFSVPEYLCSNNKFYDLIVMYKTHVRDKKPSEPTKELSMLWTVLNFEFI